MDEIFVSWGSPDKILVDRIIGRLADVGISVNEYSRNERAGDDIRSYITDGIGKARVVLALVSTAALDASTWITEELTIAGGRIHNQADPLSRLVLVCLGDVPQERLPRMLQSDRFKFLKLNMNPTEAQLEELILELRHAVGRDAPFVIPAALFAMTSDEFVKFRGAGNGQDPGKLEHLEALCRSAGMPVEPNLWDQLSSRYGDAETDFAPYGAEQGGSGRRLVDVAQGALRAVNEKRILTGRKPFYLKWRSREDFADDNVRDQWRQGQSLLVVDSVSALNLDVAVALQNLPLPGNADKAAVIFLPPYTHHNMQLEQMIRKCIAGQFFLADTFRDWHDRTERLGLAFDLPTDTSLRRWLAQLLSALETAPEPNQDNLSRMLGNNRPQPFPTFQGVPG